LNLSNSVCLFPVAQGITFTINLDYKHILDVFRIGSRCKDAVELSKAGLMLDAGEVAEKTGYRVE